MSSVSNQYSMMLDGMQRKDVYALCHLLLCKRFVDGLNGRNWLATEHYDYEQSIARTLIDNNQPPQSSVELYSTRPETRKETAKKGDSK